MTISKKNIGLVIFCTLAFCTSLDRPIPAYAQTKETITVGAQAGLDGLCKSGVWLPVHVKVENTGVDVNARVQASYKNDQNGQTVYGTDISLPATSRKEFFLYLHPDGSMRNFTVSVLDGNKTIAATNLNLTCETDPVTVFGVLADNPSAFTSLSDFRPLTGITRVAQLKLSELPDQAQGWAALDALLISNADTGTFSVEQKKALELWLANGGILFVTGGSQWQTTAAGLNDFLPIELRSTQNVTGLSELSAYAKNDKLVDQGTVVATGRLKQCAKILVEQNGIPLLIEKRIGFGKVIFFAADPSLQPLSQWEGMKEIYYQLLGFKSSKPDWADAAWDSSQANDALATLPELSLPSFIYVFCWLGLYVVVIGPANYFILRRIKRTELGWITVPVLVILFAGLAYFSGFAYRGTQPILNRITLAQGWDGVNQTQANVLVGTYSPSRASYTVETQDQFMLYPPQGVSGNVQSHDNWLSLRIKSGTTLPDMHVEIAGVQSLDASGSMPALSIQHNLVLTLSDHTPTLRGTITNASDHIIRDAVLVTPSGWKTLGDLPPDKTAEINIALSNNLTAASTSQYSIMSQLGMDIAPYPNKNDAEQRRRAAFFQANTTSPGGSINVNSGIYLMGWMNDMPAPVGLQNQSFKAIDTRLVFNKLTPALKTEGENLLLNSSILDWESSTDNLTNTSSTLPNDGYTIYFRSSLPIHISKVESLKLSIESATPLDKIQASLWNFDNHAWTLIPLILNSIDVTNAQQYVGMDGEIRLNIKTDPNDYVEISAVNFSMMVHP